MDFHVSGPVNLAGILLLSFHIDRILCILFVEL